MTDFYKRTGTTSSTPFSRSPSLSKPPNTATTVTGTQSGGGGRGLEMALIGGTVGLPLLGMMFGPSGGSGSAAASGSGGVFGNLFGGSGGGGEQQRQQQMQLMSLVSCSCVACGGSMMMLVMVMAMSG